MVQLLLISHNSYKFTEFLNTDLSALVESRISSLQVSGHISVINRSRPNLVLCVFLFKDTLFNIYYWFIYVELIRLIHYFLPAP